MSGSSIADRLDNTVQIIDDDLVRQLEYMETAPPEVMTPMLGEYSSFFHEVCTQHPMTLVRKDMESILKEGQREFERALSRFIKDNEGKIIMVRWPLKGDLAVISPAFRTVYRFVYIKKIGRDEGLIEQLKKQVDGYDSEIIWYNIDDNCYMRYGERIDGNIKTS
jgi:hypothetical protein